MYDIILFSDTILSGIAGRAYGVYRLATELRNHNYKVLVIDYCSTLDWNTFCKIVDLAITSETLAVGFSTTWFPDRSNTVGEHHISEFHDGRLHNFHDRKNYWFYQSLSYRFSQESVQPFIEYIKKINPKIKVIVGGTKSDQYLNEPVVDNIFIGFSETQLVDYMNSLSGKTSKRIFPKIIAHDPDAKNPPFSFNTSVTKYVESDFIPKKEILLFEFSRGCKFNCSFCSFPNRNQKNTLAYTKYQDTIRTELIENWEKWGVDSYHIVDDTFNDNTEKLKLIKEVIETLPFKPNFWAFIRMDLFDAHPEQIQLLKDIGIKEVYWGLEAWDDKTAKIIRKGGNLEKKLQMLSRARECWGDDIFIHVAMIVGLPEDSIKGIYDSVNWYQTTGHKIIDYFTYGFFRIISNPEEAQRRFLSDIELNYSAYGYSFPYADRPWEWVRSNSDIPSLSDAIKIFKHANELVQPYHTRINYQGIGPFLRRDAVFGHIDNWAEKDIKNLCYIEAKRNYWPALLNFLNK